MKTTKMPKIHTPTWTIDAATGNLYETGVHVGTLITGSGAYLRLIQAANQRDELIAAKAHAAVEAR